MLDRAEHRHTITSGGTGHEVLDPQGSEYTAHRFRAACERMGIRQSMGRAGSALDNAVIESWHSTLEFELRSVQRFTRRAEARIAVAAWIDDYNRHRHHSSLQMKSPIDFELGPQAP
jgi:putative transposase